jgi:hypothetical protein
MTMKTALPFLVLALSASAQPRLEPGRSIGKVSVKDNLIVMELDDAALGHANMFDFAGRTLHFTPDGAAYRIENAALQWDSDFGAELSGAQAPLHKFAFPFSGKNWDSLSVGMTGSIAFAAASPAAGGGAGRGGRGGRGGGVQVERFAQLQEAARTLVNTTPAICVFFKPRMSGPRYFKELDDRAVLTWDLTEPFAGIQDFTWNKTVNRFQAVLHKSGAIDFSYQELAARDAIVGVYPVVNAGAEKVLATIPGPKNSGLAPNLDIRNLKLSAVDGLFLKATIEAQSNIVPEGDPGMIGVAYRIVFDTKPQQTVWTIRGVGPQRGGGRFGGGAPRYVASGPGLSGRVSIKDNTISVQGTLPEVLRSTGEVAVFADVLTSANAAEPTGKVPPRPVKFEGIHSPALDLSAVKPTDGPFPIAYESFHYLSLPNARDLTCTVIKALGDKFDMLAYYSDFRVDNQEAGTPSNGPLGGGPNGGAVTGIGAQQRGLENYCTQGRFQWQFIQPVYSGSNQMQPHPPEGHTNDNNHNVGFYDRQLGERSPDGHAIAYNYAMSQIGHEMGHRWAAFVSAKVGNETIQLGPTHWATGLQAPVAFPYQRPTEASAMGGGVWQDNYDGTFTQLDDDYYVPATGWSYLDLYLMGFITAAEVPDFFILRNLSPVGRDDNGHRIFKADRTKVTIQDVIAVEGPRLPGVEHSQKNFNTGIVVITEHGQQPSKGLLENAEGIRKQWIDYWSTTTGHRSTMTATPR